MSDEKHISVAAQVPEVIPILLDWPDAMWGETLPNIGDIYALEVYWIGESNTEGNSISVKLRPKKIGALGRLP